MGTGHVDTGDTFLTKREATSSRSSSLQGTFDASQISSDTLPSTLCSRISSISLTDTTSLPRPDVTSEIRGGNGQKEVCVRASYDTGSSVMPAESSGSLRHGVFEGTGRNSPELDTIRKNSVVQTPVLHNVAANLSTMGKMTVSTNGDVGEMGTNSSDPNGHGLAAFLQRLECHGITHCDPGACHTGSETTGCTGPGSC